MPRDAPGTPAVPARADLQRRLLEWYDRNKRDLPWRDLQDPYAIWVSEVMLQQTRVETVIPYFVRWMTRFPDIGALAAAREEEVLQTWSGLGYYSRARNLHLAARTIVRQHGGRMPTNRAGLRALPGIGAYTSGAIASIAFDEAVPAVDGNVLRVLARIWADDRDILAPATRRAFEDAAAELVPNERPGDWNQALMELGATVCTPTSPDCGTCVLNVHCAAHAQGLTSSLPVRRRRQAPRAETMHFAWVVEDDHLLLVRHPPSGLLGGLWGLPGGPVETPLEDHVLAQTGVQVSPHGTLGTTTHRFTHRYWTMAVVAAGPTGGTRVERDTEARWVPLAAVRDEALSTAHRKLIEVAHAEHPVSPIGS